MGTFFSRSHTIPFIIFALDITKIKNEGYNPKVSTEDGIAQTIQWYKEQNLL